MAEPAQNLPQESSSGRKVLSGVEHLAIRLYAEGKTRAQVADILKEKLHTSGERKYAMRKLRTWEETQWFRDAVYDYTMYRMDMAIPQILHGQMKRARVRTDAARLVLEVTGRHNPRGESNTPAVVNINLGSDLPRPSNRNLGPADAEGEVIREEEDE